MTWPVRHIPRSSGLEDTREHQHMIRTRRPTVFFRGARDDDAAAAVSYFTGSSTHTPPPVDSTPVPTRLPGQLPKTAR